jgi:hypothetical protein
VTRLLADGGTRRRHEASRRAVSLELSREVPEGWHRRRLERGCGGEPAARGVAASPNADAVEAGRASAGDSTADVLRGATVVATGCPTAPRTSPAVARTSLAAHACRATPRSAPANPRVSDASPTGARVARARRTLRVGACIEASHVMREWRAVRAAQGDERQPEEQEASQDFFDV